MKRKIDRRHFIKGSAFAGMAGLVSTNCMAGGFTPERQPGVNKFSGTKLSFNNDGKFKIVQFTDTHFIAGDPRSERALENINQILDLEKPDLVIHTGDSIFGKPAEASIRQILEPMSQRGIPFAITFGNHDDEHDKTREELYEIVKSISSSIISTTEGISGVTNYILTLHSSTSDSISHVFYLFDSNAYSTIKGIEGYGHIHFDQIAWYREQSEVFAKMNGEKPVPSLAFFHIPLPEHKEAAKDTARAILKGTLGEDVCCPQINSGMFVAMKEMGDIQATFVGHDHNNDYAVYWNNMFFIYGRFSGCDTVYNDLKPSGARVIELTEDKEGFRSWIRLHGGEIIQDLQYPNDFLGD
ncbi:metallophosphoesterase family protein [Mariniphaga sediminis]|uniref:metallophosphoesterase family protein n=1 Tax=Mariniphaga sediminis TaxID=1628158 RepID=UPI0035639F72